MNLGESLIGVNNLTSRNMYYWTRSRDLAVTGGVNGLVITRYRVTEKSLWFMSPLSAPTCMYKYFDLISSSPHLLTCNIMIQNSKQISQYDQFVKCTKRGCCHKRTPLVATVINIRHIEMSRPFDHFVAAAAI